MLLRDIQREGRKTQRLSLHRPAEVVVLMRVSAGPSLPLWGSPHF